jgi:TolB-like protein
VPEPQIPEELDATKKKARKKDKLRSAWISFAGRIVAQVIGAAATVALGVFVLHQYAAPGSRPPSEEPPIRQRAPSSSRGASAGISVAVLPLENFSNDPLQAYLADSMTEDLITDLAKMDGLRVISRTSSMHFKGQRKPLREIAEQLEVQWVVEGSVTRAGNHVRITAQLIDAGTDEHVWAERYDRPVGDVLALQAEVAGAIARAVRAALPTSGVPDAGVF